MTTEVRAPAQISLAVNAGVPQVAVLDTVGDIWLITAGPTGNGLLNTTWQRLPPIVVTTGASYPIPKDSTGAENLPDFTNLAYTTSSNT